MTTSDTPDVSLPLITNIQSGVVEASDLVNGIFNGAISVLDALPPEQVGGIRDGLANTQRLFNNGVLELERILDQAGDPGALRAAGATWATDIGGTAGNLAGLATASAIRADNHWTGKAADAYQDILRPQWFALGAVKTNGDEINVVLNELANAIIDFWRNVETALITLIAGLAVALAWAIPPITTAAAVTMAATLIVTFSDNLAEMTTMFTDLNNELSIRTAEIQNRFSDNTRFFVDPEATHPSGEPGNTHSSPASWPSATAKDMSDGSVTDGDPTDWNIK